jgi:dTDP-4-amino-4,6-dideoxygalactose transaminase
VDIDPQTLQIDPNQLRAALTTATRGVIPLHLYGWPAPIPAIQEFCRQHALWLIEDCAQAHGTLIHQRHVGTWGKVGCFSFYPTKNLGAFGDAGLCITDDADLAGRLREQTCYGFRGDRTAHREGLNCRLDELQAACLRVRLLGLHQALTRRRAIARQYQAAWSTTPLRLPPNSAFEGSSWHQYVLQVNQRSAWIDWLAQAQVARRCISCRLIVNLGFSPATCRTPNAPVSRCSRYPSIPNSPMVKSNGSSP